MDMPDCLATIDAAIKYASITISGNPQIMSKILGCEMHMSQQLSVLSLDLEHAGDVFARDDQYVHRCLWVDIPKRNHLFILVDDLGIHPARGDFAENAWLIHGLKTKVIAGPEASKNAYSEAVTRSRSARAMALVCWSSLMAMGSSPSVARNSEVQVSLPVASSANPPHHSS